MLACVRMCVGKYIYIYVCVICLYLSVCIRRFVCVMCLYALYMHYHICFSFTFKLTLNLHFFLVFKFMVAVFKKASLIR